MKKILIAITILLVVTGTAHAQKDKQNKVISKDSVIEITKTQLHSFDNIHLSKLETKGISYKIVSYKLIYKPLHGNGQIKMMNGDNLGYWIRTNVLDGGDIFVIDEIYYQLPDGKQARYPGRITYNVIEK